MSEQKKFPTTLQTANLNTEKLLWLFGFRIDPDTEIPNLYTLIVYGEQEPLSSPAVNLYFLPVQN